MKYFTVEIIKDEKPAFVRVVAADAITAINWVLQHCNTEGASVADVVYVNSEPVAVVEE